MPKILLLDDDQELSGALSAALTFEGYMVDVVEEGGDALYRLQYFYYDLGILDWNVPVMSGYEVCKQYRAAGGVIPILMLTGKEESRYSVDALDVGADDYVRKPCNFQELKARIRALLRRPQQISQPALTLGPIEMDMENKTVTKNGARVDLTPGEFNLLHLFVKNPGKPFSADEILAKVFPTESEATEEAVRQRILRLRKRIDEPGSDSLIKSLKGQGYLMRSDD